MKTISQHLLCPEDCSDYIRVLNPSNGEVIAKVAVTSQQEAERRLDIAANLLANKDKWLPLHRRVEILEKVATLMTERKEELTLDSLSEGGKPYRDALVETERAIQGVRKCIEVIGTEQGHVIPMGAYANSANKMAFTQKQPIGIVVAISAFNHPLNLIVHQVGAAFAAGCPCIVKPSEDTPLSCISFVDILTEAGMPDGWVQVIVTDQIPTAEALVTSDKIAFFSFIGSAKVGWMLRSKLKPGVRCALEHGGAAPVFVTEKADLAKATSAVLKGGFYHAGQVCVSTQRVYVAETIGRQFAEGLAKEAAKLQLGDSSEITTDVGPLIRPSEVERVDEWVTEAISEGAELLCGGEPASELFYKPTVLYNPSSESRVSRLEIFGPVVCIYTYRDFSKAVAEANALPVAFQTGIFSEDIGECMAFAKGIEASAVMINDHSAFREDGMPFAGLKESGLGVGGIPHTIHDMQIEKMIVITEG